MSSVQQQVPQDALVATILLAAASGARAMTGMAALARVRASSDEGGAVARTAVVAGVMAAAEIAGDKLPNIPNRTDLFPLLGRVAAGAIIGAAIGEMTDGNRTLGAVCGGATALIAARGAQALRRRRAGTIGEGVLE